MAKQNHSAHPVTPAIRLLREKHIQFVPHLYPYQEHGGTHHAAEVLNVPEHTVIKTLVMMTAEQQSLLILMHGDRSVSTRKLARVLNVKHVTPCSEEDAHRYTGYLVGGISPFGTHTLLPVYAQATIFSLERIYINGGKHGFLLEINPADLHVALSLQEVAVETDG
jgi:Cys-tRNA(Pro) deacylase